MNKFLEVKEFDSITGNPEFEEDECFKYLDKEVFPKLIDFIIEYTGDDESPDAHDFMRISYKRNVGEVVTIKNYVGLIQMKNGYQIEVLPKICFSKGTDPQNRETKKVFLKMLMSMKDFPCKVFNNANLKVDRMNLYEIFINMYIQEVRHLVKKGIKSAYIRQEENLNYFKGKLLVGQHIKNNIVHKERFYVAYDEFHPNTAENRLVKSTLLKLLKITNSFENSKEIKQLLLAFEKVDQSFNYNKDFSLINIDRNSKDYEMIMQWSKVFLLNKSFTTFSGKSYSRALLFPMESVYESYVAQQIKKVLLPENGWEVSCQDKGKYLFTYPRKQFSLRPDIVCKKDNHTIIMDTKWKILINNESRNYGISQGDMYQMYAYSNKYSNEDDKAEIWLLYPVNDEVRGLTDICFKSEDGTKVNVFFVDIPNIEYSLDSLKNKLQNIYFSAT